MYHRVFAFQFFLLLNDHTEALSNVSMTSLDARVCVPADLNFERQTVPLRFFSELAALSRRCHARAGSSCCGNIFSKLIKRRRCHGLSIRYEWKQLLPILSPQDR